MSAATGQGERILVVEDEREQRDPIVHFLRTRGYRVDAAASGEEAKAQIVAGRHAVVLTDLRLPGIDGLEVVRHTRAMDEDAGVLLITAYASVESAVEALRLGARDYLLKPIILEDLARKVEDLVEHRRLIAENSCLRAVVQARQHTPELVATSPKMVAVLDWIRRAAKAPRSNVLIEGETGTGKEVVARQIHRQGSTSRYAFLAVNLAAMPDNLVESELFGHERGAFTGAHRRRAGVLRAAGQGTVFLDEIAELPLSAQAKLLRAIEEREVRPLGSDTPFQFEARIIAATNQKLEERVRQGLFREDLYYRLNVICIRIPPLRERPEDVPLLAQRLLVRHAEKVRRSPPAISDEVVAILCAHRWRGNVRELANVLERAVILADEDRIEPEHLPPDVVGTSEGSLCLQDAVERFERAHIALVLRLCGGNREATARQLGVSPATLYRRLDKLGLKLQDSLADLRGQTGRDSQL